METTAVLLAGDGGGQALEEYEMETTAVVLAGDGGGEALEEERDGDDGGSAC